MKADLHEAMALLDKTKGAQLLVYENVSNSGNAKSRYCVVQWYSIPLCVRFMASLVGEVQHWLPLRTGLLFHSAASMLCLDKRQSALEVNLIIFKAISQSTAEVRTRIGVVAHPSIPVM